MSISIPKTLTKIVAWVSAVAVAVAFAAPAGAIEFFPTAFRYQWKAQSGTIESDAHVVRANAGDTVPMSLTITNRSIDPKAKVIYGKSALLPEVSPYQGAHELRLGTARPHDNVPTWVDASSWLVNPDGSTNRLAVYDGAAVNPGGDLTMTWNLKISSTAANGTYDLYAGVVREFDAWARQVDSAGRLLASEDIFWRFIIGGGTTTPATGGLSVSIASDTPTAATVAYGGNANFTKLTLTAATGATVKITQIFVTRDGLSADSDVENVKLLKADGIQVGNTAGGFNALHKAQIYITPGYELTGSQDFYLRAGFISTGTVSGKTARLGIVANTDVVSNATSVSGAPVYGNYMTTVAVTIGSLEIAQDGSVTDTTPDVGDTDVITNTFKLTAGSTEPVTIDRITAIKAGSSETSDTTNIELWDVTNNKTLGTVETWTSDGKASWPVNIKLGKGDSIRLRVQLDIVDGVSLTVNTDMIDGSDVLVFVKGDTYGFYITPTIAASWGGQGAASQNINSGALVISKSSSTPATGNIAIADNQLLTVWDFDVKGESQRISAVTVQVDSNGTWAGNAATTNYVDLTNARLVDMATGNILAGPVDGAADTDSDGTYDEGKFAFTNTFVLGVGITKVGFKVRLGTDFENTDTIAAAIVAAGDVTDKGLITNNAISNTGTVPCVGNTQTVKSGALVLRTLGNPPTSNVVIGATDFTFGTFSLDASASGEDVLVSMIQITDTQGDAADISDLDNAELWADLDDNGTYETLITNTEQPSDTGTSPDTYSFTLKQTIRVPKGGSIGIALIADLSTGAATAGANDTHAFTLAADTGATSTGADTGNAITETASGTAGVLTNDDVGTISMAVDGSSPASSIVLSGTTGNTVAKFKLSGNDEAFTVEKITLLLTDWATQTETITFNQWDSISKLTIKYLNKAGTLVTRSLTPSSATAVYDNLDMYVPKNAIAILTVEANFYAIASQSADHGDQIEIGFDYGAGGTEFSAKGLSSGTAITAAGAADATASTHALYQTLLTVTKNVAGLSSVLTPGATNTLYQWTTTADSRGAAEVKRFTFQVTVSDKGTTAATTDLGGFTIVKDGLDLTATSAMIAGAGGTSGSGASIAVAHNDDLYGTAMGGVAPLTQVPRASMETKGTNDVEQNATTWVHVMFGNSSGTITADAATSIGAGNTVSWVLKGDAGSGFSGSDDDAITVELLGDATATADAAYYYLSDIDLTNSEYSIVLQSEAGTTDGADVEFVWSDISNYDFTSNYMTHAASFTDNSTTETSSGDWANAWLLKNFPLGTFSLIA